jgi:hypothetical protein
VEGLHNLIRQLFCDGANLISAGRAVERDGADELPHQESFHQVDAVMEGMANLRPQLLQRLLQECKSVKVKRLFFW